MSGPRLNAVFYAAPVEEFLAAREEKVYAPLASPHGYSLKEEWPGQWHFRNDLPADERLVRRFSDDSDPAPELIAGSKSASAPTGNRRVLTAVENGGAGRSKMVALGGVDLS